jgi:type II secretory pathway component PulK
MDGDSTRRNILSAARVAEGPFEAHGKPRRGAILVVILVCFVVAATLFVLLARWGFAEHRAAETRYWDLQAQWLAEAGLERAAARFAADANYTGETWAISANDLAGNSSGVVRINVEKDANRPNRRRVSVEADYPDDPAHRCRWQQQIVVDRREPTSRHGAKTP